MTTELTITLNDGTEADVTVYFTAIAGSGESIWYGESRATTPSDYDSVEIHSVITWDGDDVTDNCDLEEIEAMVLEALY